jgi:hypothetical protein
MGGQVPQFVSQYPGYRHGVRDEVPEHLGHDGFMVPFVRPLEAVFDRGGLTPEAITEAKAKLTFHGLMEHESGDDLDPIYRISVFDSEVMALQEGWSDEEQALVINVLRASTENGRAYVEIVAAPATIPWGNYDDIDDPDKVVEIAQTIEADIGEVIRYELENQNRERWLEALNDAKSAQEEVVTVKA